MDKKTVDVYIAGSHFKINHEDAEYVKRVADIVNKRITALVTENEGTALTDNMILACLDICDDMLTARAEAEALSQKNEEQIAKINSLEREIEYFKNPKFVIPKPIGKANKDIPDGQLCFPPFENRAALEPAVNGLTVANLRKTPKSKKR